MRKLIQLYCIILISIVLQFANASELPLTMDLQNTNLPDALRLIAQFLHQNIIISPTVTGFATLSLHDATPADALDLLLNAHGLAKWQIGNVILIATQEELLKRKQDQLKWQQVETEAATLVTQAWTIRYAKAEDIAHIIQDEHASLLSKRGQIRVDTRTNVICIQDTAEHLAEAHRLIQRLDVPVQQIEIKARLASVDNDYERELGVNFNATNSSAIASAAENAGRYSIATVKLADGSLLDVRLSALENTGHAEVISTPRLFTANQQAASIESGEEVPYQEVSRSGGTATAFKKAVLGLKVTPQVLPGNRILLQLQINQDRPSSKMILGVPTISTRQISTNVLVKAGRTIVLGGIYENNQEVSEQGLPFLSQIPLLGVLFRQQNVKRSKRELLIFVTPTIVTPET